jgi:hypothetical protein
MNTSVHPFLTTLALTAIVPSALHAEDANLAKKLANGGPEWGLRFGLTFLFQKSQHPT